jgi:hypothetical protein
MTTAYSIRTTIDPWPVPGVNEKHLEGMFGSLADMIDARLQHLRTEAATRHVKRRIRFWEFAREELDPQAHARIQVKYLTQGGTRRFSGLDQSPQGGLLKDIVKYIDPIEWLENKLQLCVKMGLEESPPLSILDLGTGPGHFPFVARFFGHTAIGSDLPAEVNDGREETFIYDDLCAFYGVERIPLAIQAGVALPDLGKRFDLVTSFLTAFNTHKDPRPEKAKEKGEPWMPQDWAWFVGESRRTWLTANGRIVMTLTREKTPEEPWAYLESIARSADRSRRAVEIWAADQDQ